MATESLVFDILARDGASPSFAKVGLAAEKASGNLKDLSDKLKDVSGRTANARVGLEGDKEAQHELDTLDAKLARLAKNVSKPSIDLAGIARARAEISGVDLALDRLDHKRVTATVDVDVNRSGLRGVLAQIRGAVTGEQGAFGGAGGLLSSPIGLGGIAGGALVGAGLIPGVAGLGLGLLTGGAAAGGGLAGAAAGNKVIAADQALIKQITAARKSAIGDQKKQLSQALREANKQYAKDMKFFTPFLEFQGAIKNLAKVFLAPLRPIMEPLVGIVNQFAAALKTLGPQFTELFQASLPFLRQFADVLLKSGDILIPAFTDALNEMVKSGALKIMTDALVVLVRGLGHFIEALGPGMKASAEIFARLMGFIAKALPVVGAIFSKIAQIITSDWSPGHLWNGLLRSAQAFWHAVVASFHTFWHTLTSSFDAFRHDVASIWDTIWDNTVGRTKRGISDVVGWFKGLPGKVIGALFGLGHNLYAFARAALGDFLAGFRSLAGTVKSWVSNFVHTIWNLVKSFFRIGSPSGLFYDIGKNLMLGLFHGIKDHAGKAQNAWGGAIGGLGGPTAAGAAQAQSYARSRLSAYGWGASQMGALIALWNGESGWNRLARNPSSGAYGIPQALPPSKMGAAANPPTSSAAAQINWGLGYIRSTYGSPSAAYSAWLSRSPHWYGKGGIIGEPVLGVGLRSGRGYGFGETGPEMVSPLRGHRSQRMVIEFRSGPGEVDQFLTRIMERIVRTQGGGDVQAAFGTSY